MNRQSKILIALAALAFGIYGFFQLIHPTVTINYRLTLEVMTPEGPTTGSGVIQVSYGSEFNLNGGGRRGVMRVTGEAVPVDLGHGKFLFATLTNDMSGRQGSPGKLDGALNASSLPVQIFGFSWSKGEENSLASQAAQAMESGSRDVPIMSLPTLVTFQDLNDTKSIRLVRAENPAAVLGTGYSLTKATITLTNDPPTEGIEKLLVWLKKMSEPKSPAVGNSFESD
jgi:hypothetical protein